MGLSLPSLKNGFDDTSHWPTVPGVKPPSQYPWHHVTISFFFSFLAGANVDPMVNTNGFRIDVKRRISIMNASRQRGLMVRDLLLVEALPWLPFANRYRVQLPSSSRNFFSNQSFFSSQNFVSSPSCASNQSFVSNQNSFSYQRVVLQHLFSSHCSVL